jgi:hypothetical protein
VETTTIGNRPGPQLARKVLTRICGLNAPIQRDSILPSDLHKELQYAA